MADLIRSAKSGSNWKSHDLHSYNIVIEYQQDVATFFEVAQLPEPHVSPEMLERVEADDIEDIYISLAVGAKNLAMTTHPTEESASLISLCASSTCWAIPTAISPRALARRLN